MKRAIQTVLLSLTLSYAVGQVAPASPVALRQVRVVRQSTTEVQIEISLSGPVTPEILAAEHPKRLILVLPGTSTDSKQKRIVINANGIRAVRYALNQSSPPETHVVVDLEWIASTNFQPGTTRSSLRCSRTRPQKRSAALDRFPPLPHRLPASFAVSKAFPHRLPAVRRTRRPSLRRHHSHLRTSQGIPAPHRGERRLRLLLQHLALATRMSAASSRVLFSPAWEPRALAQCLRPLEASLNHQASIRKPLPLQLRSNRPRRLQLSAYLSPKKQVSRRRPRLIVRQNRQFQLPRCQRWLRNQLQLNRSPPPPSHRARKSTR